MSFFQSTGSFFKDLYYCNCIYDCSMKYLCGVIALFFVVLYGVAVFHIRKNRSFQVDLRDKLLISTALL